MRRFLLLCAPILLTTAITGCGASGPKPGMPDEISVGVPTLPPGTSDEMAGVVKKPRSLKTARSPGSRS